MRTGTVSAIDEMAARLARQDAVLVQVHATEGSTPRERGAWMAVFADAVVGTIGGGQLEFQAIAEARRRLSRDTPALASIPASAQAAAVSMSGPVRYPLGPALGQCCGGVMHLFYESVGAADVSSLKSRLAPALTPLALFGGGHVGQALIDLLGTLPFSVRWIDSRDDVFPHAVPADVACEHSDPVQAAVADLAPASIVLIMSFSHAEDLDVLAACLRRRREHGDLPWIGLIGSKTKWATFQRRLSQRGFTDEELARVVCPIGLPGITGKEPAVIAVGVAAQLLLLPH